MIFSRSRHVWAAAAAIVLPVAAASACSSDRDVFVGRDCGQGLCNESTGFTSPDAGLDSGTATSPDVPMCAVTTCAAPRATCPSSAYPCDVDLSRDNENCGGCGIRCGNGVDSNWSCVDGQCTFACGNAASGTGNQGADCDNDPTNGCEVDILFDNDNCGDCGYACPEGKSCTLGKCLSLCDMMAMYFGLPDDCGNGLCTNFNYDDANCGACGNACDPTGPSLPKLPADMHYGCGSATCGKTKCNDPNRANCNGDTSDGCETAIHDNANCAFCGDTCAPGKQCILTTGNRYVCACEDDAETLCGSTCERLDEDPNNCGACNRICPGTYSPHFAAACTHGVCGGRCEDGYADCDALPDNGCEVDIRVDNRNCGACGKTCLPDQVCAEGKCLVAPCESGPETTAK